MASKDLYLSEEEIIQATCYNGIIYFLNKDGTITQLEGESSKIDRTDNVKGWTDIEQFAVGWYGLLGIKKDGTVVYATRYVDPYFDYSENLTIFTTYPNAVSVTPKSYECSEPAILYADGTIIPISLVQRYNYSSFKVPNAKDIAVPTSDRVYVLMNDASVKLFLWDYDRLVYKDCGTIATNVKKMAHSVYGEILAILFEDGTVQIIDNWGISSDQLNQTDLKLKDFIREQCSIDNSMTNIIDIEIDYNCNIVAINANGKIVSYDEDEHEFIYLESPERAKSLESSNGYIIALS